MADVSQLQSISTHAPRTGSDAPSPQVYAGGAISTHAPRTGSDGDAGAENSARCGISTHAPRTGSDFLASASHCFRPLFQPTLPARGATRCSVRAAGTTTHFNPRSPHGERHGGGVLLVSLEIFQPTLPARGATPLVSILKLAYNSFQPTLPARGATLAFVSHIFARGVISTHAPRTGSDQSEKGASRRDDNFNPRSPHGERRVLAARLRPAGNFNPRSPHGERLPDVKILIRKPTDISTHAPRTGSDAGKVVSMPCLHQFQPTLPARGATVLVESTSSANAFQPTLPARGAT